jgi:superfamily II DNA/RNA helicase
MESFRRERADVLVATNVAARGLDVSHVGLVINYDLPDTAEALTHRIGRTARNGNTGRALTFITAEDHENWAKLRRQGAPMLRTVDASLLVKDGDWSYLEEPAHQSRPGAPKSASRRRRSSRPLGRRRVHLD